MEETDIWFSAKLLIDCHGKGARLEAARQLAAFHGAGDDDAADAWMRIHQAIVLLTQLQAHPANRLAVTSA